MIGEHAKGEGVEQVEELPWLLGAVPLPGFEACRLMKACGGRGAGATSVGTGAIASRPNAKTFSDNILGAEG